MHTVRGSELRKMRSFLSEAGTACGLLRGLLGLLQGFVEGMEAWYMNERQSGQKKEP